MQIDGQALAKLITDQYFSQSRGVGGRHSKENVLFWIVSWLCEQAATNQQDSRVIGVLRCTRSAIGYRKMLR